ncbi:N-acetylmuramoyl-L-alanine amidase [Rhodococcus sp. X156]|uniref:N-acetylmuramoyl-L-alanine amidase n=1 Tax=Rhodococcus sp. X156 TaxID=2499145 RepID=UPI001F4979A4|nr:N-acetylmuramoyl-L-alanine amidase [Rhodococcus sp. X156]
MTAAAAGPLAGKLVVLDPGHNGGNADNPDPLDERVPNGRGGTAGCNSTGTSTDDNYAEHAFNWSVAQHARSLLEDQGASVRLTRGDNDGVGPCVDRRAAIGNTAGADVVVSIHADGADSDEHGFHVIYNDPPLNDAQAGPAVRLASVLRDAMVEQGHQPATYLAGAGIATRDDLANLNLSTRPTVLIECINMRNPVEAERAASEEGRADYARGIAEGIRQYLAGG